MSEKIGIVTVLYNSETVVTEFFETLNIQTYKNFVLYVIDNKSPDKSLELSRELAKKCDFETVIIAHPENSGVAKGNNIGIERALADSCDLVLLSNNDVVLEPDTIKLLYNEMRARKVDMAVPKIYFHGTNQIWAAGGGFIPHRGCVRHFGALEVDNGQFNTAIQIAYAPTCFMLIDKTVFERSGIMDEKFFVYYDDTDFVYRALKKGVTLWYIPNSLLHHKESTSTGVNSKFQVFYLNRNLVYFCTKNYSSLYAFYVISFNLLEHVIKHFFKFTYPVWKEGIRGFKEGFKLSFSRN